MKRLLRPFRWLARLLVLAVVAALAGVSGVVWLTLPGGTMTQRIEGLDDNASISIDADGIPRIRAVNDTDAAVALGFLHARERMFQMDLMRRAARGELSEVVGPATLRIDEFNRTLNLRDRVEADLLQLTPSTRKMLDSYVAGVNAWIARKGRLSALEFAVLGAPRPWTTADSLLWGKTMGLYLSGNWRTELARLSLSDHLGHEQIEALWPEQSALSSQALLSLPDLQPGLSQTASRLAEYLPRFPDRFTLPPTASNEWAVDGAHSATGSPLLAGDPHLSFGLPGVWYLARIDTPRGPLVGATAPGVPFLVIGHNGRIAWTFTTTGADVQDLFIETAQDGGYLTENGTLPFVTRTEIIHVRGAADEVLHVRETRHGPIISDLVGDHDHLISLAMANLSPGDGAASGLLALNHAGSVAEAGTAAAQITSPVQNMLVADRDGIGLFVTGRVPIRKSGHGAFPARGDDGSHDWTGWAQGQALPHITNPPSGRLINANERVVVAGSNTDMGRDWYGDTRARRIRMLLDANPKANAADFTSMQIDDLDLVATTLLPRLQQIEPMLNGWDGRMGIAAAAPLVFNAWMMDFAHTMLVALDVPDHALSAAAPWPDLVRAALSSTGSSLCAPSCDAMLHASHDRAMAALTDRFGSDRAKWHWGDAHQAVFPTLVLRAIPVLGPLAEARIATVGSDSTLGRGGVRAGTMDSIIGASYRGVYDLSDLEHSQFMVAPGQSGDPFSRLARNFLRQWRDGETIFIQARPTTVDATIRLTP